MKKQKILYAITTEDVINVSDQKDISFTEKELSFIQNKIEDYLGDKWQDVIQFAISELKNNKQYDADE